MAAPLNCNPTRDNIYSVPYHLRRKARTFFRGSILPAASNPASDFCNSRSLSQRWANHEIVRYNDPSDFSVQLEFEQQRSRVVKSDYVYENLADGCCTAHIVAVS